MDDMNGTVYTVENIQRLLKISRKTAYELMREQLFPVRKVLNQYRIPKLEFDDWLHGKHNDFLATETEMEG